MKKLFLFFLLLSIVQNTWAQFPVGHTTITFNDASRTGGFGSGGGPGRQIQTEIYYPATTTGQNMPMANGSHSLIVFGHGFAMAWDAYEPFYNHWAAQGYVVALPRTEGGLAPDHLDLAKDMGIVSHDILSEAAGNSNSIFYLKMSPRIAIGGHSMGGGAAILSNVYQVAGVTCYLTFAAAETTPSATQAAVLCTAPSLFISGSKDCVVPTLTQRLMYDSMASQCKTHIELEDAYHCQFNGYNFTCATGEATCFTPGGITRDSQINRSLAYADDFLDFYLNQNCTAWTSFKSKYDNNYGTLTSKITNCAITFPTPPVLSFNGTKLTTPSGIFSAYIWKRDGNIVHTGANPNYTPSQNGSFVVCAQTNSGCYLESAPFIFNNLSAQDFKKQNEIQIDYQNKRIVLLDNNLEFTIYSMNGQKISQYKRQTSIPYNNLPSGVYLLQVVSKNSVVLEKLLVY